MRGADVTKTTRARRLRRSSTDAEARLWNRIRSRALGGYKFVRQEPIGRYIVDFVCRERRLIIELDGGQHATDQRDAERDEWLAGRRYRVLRFWNNDVMRNIEGVLETIATALNAETPPHPDRTQPSLRRLRKLACGAIRPLPASGERWRPRRYTEPFVSPTIS